VVVHSVVGVASLVVVLAIHLPLGLPVSDGTDEDTDMWYRWP
jgi:hypothetical protein